MLWLCSGHLTLAANWYIYATDWESAEIFVKLFYPQLKIVGEFVAEIDFNTMKISNNNFYN